MTKDEFFATVTPALMTFMGVAVPALMAWLTNIVRCWANKQNEAKDREALHMALETGVKAARAKGKTAAQDVADAALTYAYTSVPDAIENLDASPDVLSRLALSKTMEKSHA